MNSADVMRIADKLIGIPLCFILSLIDWFTPKLESKHKNLLFIELIEMGSTVLAYPAINKAIKDYPGSNMFFLIFKDNQSTVELLSTFKKENILTIRHKNAIHLLIDTIKAVIKMRKLKIDTVINLELFTRYSQALTYLSGAKERIGFHKYELEGLYMGDLLTKRVVYNPYQHISINFINLIEAMSSEDYPTPKISPTTYDLTIPKLQTEDNARINIWKKLKAHNKDLDDSKKLFVLNCNASQMLPQRKWPTNNYAQLIKMILAQSKDNHAILMGLEIEWQESEALRKQVNDKRCINLCGETDLRELIDLLNMSAWFITNDSGPAHFQSLATVKSIILFGPEIPLLYGPLGDNNVNMFSRYSCSPCVSAYNHRKTKCSNNKCLQAITSEQVFKVIQNG